MYYLSPDYIVQEACYSVEKGWYAGGLNDFNIKAATNSAIAAFTFNDQAGLEIRVYFQGQQLLSTILVSSCE